MTFEWDDEKNTINQRKHGVSFEEAQQVFNDPLQVAILDHRFNYLEERWINIGESESENLLVVANLFFTDDGEEIVRIISARQASNNERKSYEKC